MSISFPGGKFYKKNNGTSPLQPIRKTLPSPVYIYPTVQSESIVLKPLVEKDDYVLAGQKIADLDTFNALPIIAGVSGKVKEVSDDKIVIENDMLERQFTREKPSKNINELETREILWLLREGGVCEVSTGEPVHVMLSPEITPDCVLLRCFDSDPYVSSPQASALGNAWKILFSLKRILKILGIKKAFIGVESDTHKIFSDFKYRLRYNEDITLYSLKPRYPQSRDDILTKTMIGKDIDKINAPIFTAETLLNIYNVLHDGSVITTKTVTVSGDDILTPSNYRAMIGAPISSLLSDAGYTSPEVVILGGVVDGERICDLDEPVTRSTKAVIAFNDKNNIPEYRKKPI